MKRDGRYGAYLILSLVLFGVFFVLRPEAPHQSPVSTQDNVQSSQARPEPFPGFPIDINTATEEELAMLPGIGRTLARRIVEKRASLGRFRSIDELTEVERVGRVRLERLRPLVTVKGESRE